MTTMTASIIDLDRPETGGTGAQAVPPLVLPARMWLPAWARQHSITAGAAAGVAVAVVATLVWLSALALRPTPAPPATGSAPAAASHTISVSITNADATATTVLRRDGAGVAVSRGEVIGADPVQLPDVVGLSVTVSGPRASCTIVVDGVVADQAAAVHEGGMTACVWIAS